MLLSFDSFHSSSQLLWRGGGVLCACGAETNGAQRCAEELTNERRSRCVIRDWRHRGGCVVHNTLTVWAPRTHSHPRARTRAQPRSLCYLWWVTYSRLRRLTCGGLICSFNDSLHSVQGRLWQLQTRGASAQTQTCQLSTRVAYGGPEVQITLMQKSQKKKKKIKYFKNHYVLEHKSTFPETQFQKSET